MWPKKKPAPRPLDRASLKFFPRSSGALPTHWPFPAYLDNPGCRWLQCLKEMYAMPIIFPASLSPEGGMLLHALIRNLQPRVVVEIGTFMSVSTHWIGAALRQNGPGGVIHCFDDFGPVHKALLRNAEMLSGRLEWVKDRLTRAGLIDLVRFHPGDSAAELVAARDDLAAAGGVQFAFIDGDHTVEGAVRDLKAVEPVLDTGGYVLLHDTYPDQCGGHLGPRYVMDHLYSVSAGQYEKIELYLAPWNYGLGLLRRVG